MELRPQKLPIRVPKRTVKNAEKTIEKKGKVVCSPAQNDGQSKYFNFTYRPRYPINLKKLGISKMIKIFKGDEKNTFPYEIIIQKFEEDLEDLHLEYLNLNGNALGHFAKCFQVNSTIATLNLKNNNITNVGFEKLMISLEHSEVLSRLNLSHNKLGGVKNGISFSSVFRYLCENVRSLRYLDLSHNLLSTEDGLSIANNLNSCKMRGLYLNNNRIGSDFGPAFSKMIGDNSDLREINIEYNQLNSISSFFVIKGLRTNTFLTHLHMSWSSLDEKGGSELVRIVKNNKVLKEVYIANNQIPGSVLLDLSKAILSNQTCLIRMLDISNNPINFEECLGIMNNLEAVEPRMNYKIQDVHLTRTEKRVFFELQEKIKALREEKTKINIREIEQQITKDLSQKLSWKTFEGENGIVSLRYIRKTKFPEKKKDAAKKVQ